MKNVTAIILGGGRGTRLFPLTLERAKPAVSFLGKYRLIDIPISNCVNSGIKRVFVLTQFMSASLHRHIMQTYQFDMFSGGFVDVLAAEQTPQSSDWFQGTADAVRATLIHTLYYKAEQVLILSGDHLYRMDYSDLIRFHRERRAKITICVYPVTYEEAPRMGLLRVDDPGNVMEFVEKPKDREVIERFRAPECFLKSQDLAFDSERYLASMGIYVFEPHVLLEVLSSPSEPDFGKQIIPSAIQQHQVMAYPFSGYWKDIGTVASFFEANIALAHPKPAFPLYLPHWPIHTRARALPPCRVIHSDIRDSLLVEGSDITGASISTSIVGMRSIIREGTRIDGAVILGADFYEGEQAVTRYEIPEKEVPSLGIGRDCFIEKAIIDKNARIGDGVTIRAQPDIPDYQEVTHWIRDGITVIPRGAVIPSGFRL
jgi:glucose-1-phosphate adenylyltransferase